MPIISTSTIHGTSIVLAGPLLLSPDSSTIESDASIPQEVRAVLVDIRPPVGARAKLAPADVPPTLQVVLDSVSDETGHTITLSLANSMAPIYYTLDGGTPTNLSTPYSVPIRITGTPGQIIHFKYKAVAVFGSGFDDSAVYSIQVQIPQKVALRYEVDEISANEQQVGILPTPSTGSFVVKYTTTGSAPNMGSPQYATPFLVVGTPSSSVVVKATAFVTAPIGLFGGLLPSDETELDLGF